MWLCCEQILDVGHNQLLNISVTQLLASQINVFDMSLNSQLKFDPDEFKSAKYVSFIIVNLSIINAVFYE